MIAIITQEEESFKKEKSQSVHFAVASSKHPTASSSKYLAASSTGTKGFKGSHHKGKHHSHDKKRGNVVEHLEPKKKSFKYKGECKYCKKYGHKVDDCYFLKRKL